MASLGTLLPRRRARRRADRVTVGLAAAALATAGTVIAGEVARLARRRTQEAEPAEGVLDTAEQALSTAGMVTSDAVAVAVEAYEAAPRHEVVLFNMLSGFIGGFALMRLSTAGI